MLLRWVVAVERYALTCSGFSKSACRAIVFKAELIALMVFGFLPLFLRCIRVFSIISLCLGGISVEKGKFLLEIPATVGVIGAVLVPWLAALGVVAALATNCRIVVERRE